MDCKKQKRERYVLIDLLTNKRLEGYLKEEEALFALASLAHSKEDRYVVAKIIYIESQGLAVKWSKKL